MFSNWSKVKHFPSKFQKQKTHFLSRGVRRIRWFEIRHQYNSSSIQNCLDCEQWQNKWEIMISSDKRWLSQKVHKSSKSFVLKLSILHTLYLRKNWVDYFVLEGCNIRFDNDRLWQLKCLSHGRCLWNLKLLCNFWTILGGSALSLIRMG